MMQEFNAFVMPGFHTCVAEWLACCTYILCVPRRLHGWKLAGVLAGTLLVLLATNLTREGTYGVLWIALLFLGLAAMYACIRLCTKGTSVEAGYTWAHAFVLAEFAASLEWEAVYYFVLNVEGDLPNSYLLMVVAYAVCFGVVLFIEKRPLREMKPVNVRGKNALGAVMIAVAVFAISNISFAFQDTAYSQSLGVGMLTVRTLVDLAGLLMLYAQREYRREVALQYELEGMNSLFQSQFEQYQRYRENDEIIRKQYHDLKHQIAMIRAERDPHKQDSYLAQMDKSIELYQTQHKTGNAVVDTMLSGKSMVCREKGIQLLSYADAAPLSFMNAMDICSIFGNALDNAIECVEKLQDPEKRQIKVYVYTQSQFLMIRFENFYDQAPHFENGLPITTKDNRMLHGYGIRNIYENVRKYNGNVTIHTENGCFQLLVLLPLSNQTTGTD